VPTSVLLAVLAAAGLLALAPALVRRYDATERLVAERALSTARVVTRAGSPSYRRRRTVPGRRPVNPPRALTGAGAVSVGGTHGVGSVAGDAPVGSGRRRSLPVGSGRPARRQAKRTPRRLAHPPAVYRRRRVFAALLLFNIVELAGVALVSPGFWISETVSGTLLVAYLVHLRNRALAERRRRRAEARYTAWVAARQAAVRREQTRRVAVRRELLRQQLLEREQARRDTARLAAVRGRAYESRALG